MASSFTQREWENQPTRSRVPPIEPILVIAALHLFAVATAIGVIALALGEPPLDDDRDDGDGGSPARLPPYRPRGGPPLPTAVQSRLRLRGPGRLADLRPRRPRRGPAEPARPRTPTRHP